MSFTDRLLLWLHIGFAIFTLGPVTAAMMATPRYIKARDLAVLRYLCRTTGIFGLLTIGVLLFGMVLGRNDFSQAWLSASLTLFVVSAVLLALVFRDQRRAISAIAAAQTAAAAARTAVQAGGAAAGQDMAAAGTAGPAERAEPGRAPAAGAGAGAEAVSAPAGQPGGPQATSADPAAPGDRPAPPAGGAVSPGHVATVERGRIASMAGVISLIWLAILVLMVWHG